MIECADSPVNGTRPVNIWYATIPSAYRSAPGLPPPSVTISGAMYSKVPTTTPTRVRRDSSIARAMPKSISVTLSSGATMTLEGLMSRWTTPRAWA
jgi:hypothetical protein